MPTLDIPPNEEPEKKSIQSGNWTWEEYRRVQIWLNVAPWKCECKITNFGRNTVCARHGCGKPRPSHYTKTGGI
jgi:hypothetical protein